MNKQQIYKKIGPYQLIKEIGIGSFARVYLAKMENSEEKFAIKMISKDLVSEENLRMIDKEIEILLALNHPNIIKYLVFEYCEFGDLQQYIKNHYNGRFPEDLAQKIIKQISKGIKEMHRNKIVHRDLKLANILINTDFVVKLGDFGFAKYFGDNNYLQSFCGTPITMAIEILKREKYNEKCDMWSIGVIIYQMLYGEPPFNPKKGGHINDLITAIEENPVHFNEDIKVSDEAKDIISKTLVINPEQRISFIEFFEHPWILGKKQKESMADSNLSAAGEYQELLKSAYNQKNSQSSKVQKQKSLGSGRKMSKISDDIQQDASKISTKNITAKDFLHSSVEEENHKFSNESINEYLGMTLKQKVKNNFIRFFKYVQDFNSFIEKAKTFDMQELSFFCSLLMLKKAMVLLNNQAQITIEEIKFEIPFDEVIKAQLRALCEPLIYNISQIPINMNLEQGATQDFVYKYLFEASKYALENEYNIEKSLIISIYQLCLNILKLLQKPVNIIDVYKIRIMASEAEISKKVDQNQIIKSFSLSDEEISKGTFSRKLFDLFEFDFKNSEDTKLDILSQKDIDQQEQYLRQRISSIQQKMSDSEQNKENQEEENKEEKQLKQQFKDKEECHFKTNDDSYDEEGFDQNYKM